MDCDLQTLLDAQPSSNAPTDTRIQEQQPPLDGFQQPPRPETPDNEILLPDEPSSALASRIIRAQDNPSPPPVSARTRTTPSRLIDISEPTTPFNPARGPTTLPDHFFSSLLSPVWGPASVKPSACVTPQRDLITFDVDDESAMALNDSKLAESEIFKETIGNTCGGESTDERPRLDVLLTPVRRSGRARRSATPRQTYPGTVVEGSANYLEQPRTMMSPTRSQARRKKDKTATLEETISESFVRVTESRETCTTEDPSEAFFSDSTEPTDVFPHRLSSLSPSSSHVLDRLAGKSPDKKDPHLSKLRMSNETGLLSETSFPGAPKTPSPKKPGPSRRLQLDGSPSKPSAGPDLLRTPARRILIEDAPVSHIRPASTARLATPGVNFGLPRTPVLHIPPTDSPARRMLVSERVADDSRPPGHHVTASHSRSHPMHNRSQSAEPSLSKPLPFRTIGRSTSVEPLLQQSSKHSSTFFRPPTGTKQPVTRLIKLPFPLVAKAIPEEEERSKSTVSKFPVPNSKYRTSKIPRIGSKPYARPTATTKIVQNGPLNGTRTANLTKAERPSQWKAAKHVTSDRTDIHIPMTLPHTLDTKAVANLKRKRSPEVTASSRKLPGTVPDQVHRPSAPQVAESSKVTSNPPGNPVTDAAQQSDGMLNITQENAAPSQNMTSPTDQGGGDTKNQSAIMEVENVLGHVLEKPLGGEQNALPSTDCRPTQRGKQPITPESLTTELPESSSSSDMRRTTRARKKTQPATTDISRSFQSRRRAGNVPAPVATDAFSGMSAVALKTLTNANTVRNQQYIAARLETEVIRKLGLRPTSPTVKIRTTLQRTQDEKGRQRQQRAERRARRTQEGLPNSRDSDSEDELELPTLAELDLEDLDGHRRGAGEDGDYKTPERQLKKLKLTDKFTDNPDLDETRERRRVKWDKGLFTAIYLDEVQLGARPLRNDLALGRGCLALTSKTAQLDSMGNLPNANVPVANLVEENVVVKKFMYDDDEEAKPPIAKGTRSRSKKYKS
ncbi:hypothetical protein AX15_003919 [Amanita polypyramis BW_CC]|nr:hypothetical protein AX15_003919 [Amanita polypyramis BW_CC]